MSRQSDGNHDAQREFTKQLEGKVRAEDQIKNDEAQVNASIQNAVGQSEFLKQTIKNASNKLDTAYQMLDIAGWIVPIGVALIYYAIFLYYGLPEAFTYAGLELAVLLFLFLRLVIWGLRIQLLGEDKSFVDCLKDSFASFSEKHVKLRFDDSRFSQQVSNLGNHTIRMLGTVRSYVPGLDQYYSSQERLRNQLYFKQKLRNALTEYGLPIREKTEHYLSTEFGPLTNTEHEWLEEATKGLAVRYGIPAIILKLVYADYLDDNTERKIAWEQIKKDKLVSALAKVVLNSGRVPTEYIERDQKTYGGIEELIATIEPFKLNDFLVKYTDYYYKFAEEKDALIDALKFYRLNITSQLESEIKKLIPPAFEERERLRSIMGLAASRIGINYLIVELIYYEYQGIFTERHTAWVALKNNNLTQSLASAKNQSIGLTSQKTTEEQNSALTTFIALLLDSGLLKVQSINLDDNKLMINYIANLLEPKDDFTIAQTRIDLIESLRLLERLKDDFIRTLSLNNISFVEDNDRTAFMQLLPTTDPFRTLLNWLSARVKVDETVLLLLFYDYTAQKKKRDDCFQSFKENDVFFTGKEKLIKLAHELLNRGIISYPTDADENDNDTITNLADYLAITPMFERLKIDSTFSEYNKLFRYAKSILIFLVEQKICHEKSEITFNKLLTKVAKVKGDLLGNLQIATIMELRDFTALSFDDDWFEPIALSSIAVYLVVHEDMSLADLACRRYSSNSMIVKILYEYSWMNEKEQHKSQIDRSPFSKVIEIAIKGSSSSTRYLSEFQRGLKTGFLYRRINDIPAVRLHFIQQQISEVVSQQDYAKKLDSHLQALGTVLESKLKTDTIIESLKMQLVSAYAITFPTDADVISGIIDGRLLEVCEELAREDPIYKDIFIKAEIQEVSIGKATRVGVVPYGMSFSDFSNRLQMAYKIAVSRYQASGKMHHEPNKYVSNIVRIFPTAAYFKQLEPIKVTDELESESSLADLLRPLIFRKFGARRSVEILASLKTSVEEKTAVRNILASLYDSSSALYLVAQQQFDMVLSSPTLRDYIKSGQFDGHLLQALEAHKLSELAIATYRTAKEGVKQKEAVTQKIQAKVKLTCTAIRSRPSDSEVDAVASTVFSILFDVGMILDALK